MQNTDSDGLIDLSLDYKDYAGILVLLPLQPQMVVRSP